jgi:hypothetical protein
MLRQAAANEIRRAAANAAVRAAPAASRLPSQRLISQQLGRNYASTSSSGTVDAVKSKLDGGAEAIKAKAGGDSLWYVTTNPLKYLPFY